MKSKKLIFKILRTTIFLFLLIVMLLPIVIAISTSLKTYKQVLIWPPKLFEFPLQWSNFREVLFGEKSILDSFFNSLEISIIVMILCILIGSLAAYAVTRFNFKGKKTFLILIIVTQMFSSVILVNPMYIMFRNLGILNTKLSLIISNTASAIPMTTWLLHSYFSAIPIDYEEAAWMDGASRIRTIFDVLLPIATPGIITSGLFAFIGSWGDIVYARTFIVSNDLRTIAQSLTDYQDLYKVNWELQMAASLITTIPPFIIFLLIQRKLIDGMMQEGLKG